MKVPLGGHAAVPRFIQRQPPRFPVKFRGSGERREAAEVFCFAGSIAVKWLQRWEKSGSAETARR